MLPIAPLALAFLPSLPIQPSDWPQWRGPARDGVSTETDWSSTGAEKSLWERRVGRGYSSVAVVGGRLYTKGFDEEAGKDVVWCLDAETGEEIWTHAYPARIWNEMHGGGTLSTPSVDQGHVYVLDREGRFLRLSAEDGSVEWERDLAKEYELKAPKWGFAASPLVLPNEVVLNLGLVLAFDKEKGELLWKSAKNYGDAYSTPVDLDYDGSPSVAVFDAAGLALLRQQNGEELQSYPWTTKYDVNASTPVVADDRVFISSGLGRGGAMLKLGGMEPTVLWESKVMSTKMSGCILWEKHLYGFDESVLKCVDLDGNETWRARGLGNGALIGAGGRLVCTSSKGELVVVQATPEEYRELSRAEVVTPEGAFWATPVLSGGLIYVRSSLGALVCRDHRKRSE